jgi:hypothetical protein
MKTQPGRVEKKGREMKETNSQIKIKHSIKLSICIPDFSSTQNLTSPI